MQMATYGKNSATGFKGFLGTWLLTGALNQGLMVEFIQLWKRQYSFQFTTSDHVKWIGLGVGTII